jgi:uncharacterized membrane protein YozB (DUF420 family)
MPLVTELLALPEFLASGFLPNRATATLDFVVVAMVLVLIALAVSIRQIRNAKNPRLHRLIQLVTAGVLLLTLVVFEVDMQFLTDWRELAEPSPYFDSGVVNWALWIHLMFAIPTPLVWAGVIWFGLSRFKESFEAGDYNRVHRFWGRIASGLMVMTAITGWVFYYLAFVA